MDDGLGGRLWEDEEELESEEVCCTGSAREGEEEVFG